MPALAKTDGNSGSGGAALARARPSHEDHELREVDFLRGEGEEGLRLPSVLGILRDFLGFTPRLIL